VVRSVLVESEMKAILVVPDPELLKQPSRMTLTRHNDVIEEFAVDSADEALGVIVHLRGANSGPDGTDAEILDSARELVSIRPIAISDHESGCRVSGEGIDRLLAEPESGWDERPQKESNQAEHAERIRGENEPEEAGPGSAGTSIG
jgi:hypothetical protein